MPYTASARSWRCRQHGQRLMLRLIHGYAAIADQNSTVSTYIRGGVRGPMQTIEEILDAARRLSDGERRRLVEALQGDGREASIDEQRRDAMASWLGLAGRLHSAFTPVSTEKYTHLADVYADER